MPKVPIIENPRRRRRHGRRSLTAAQLAAGFGGKSAMHGKRRSSRRRHARRNPGLAEFALGNPRRRRRSYGYTHPRRRRHYRNPVGAMKVGPFQFDLVSAAWVAGGMVAAKALPTFIKKAWSGMPDQGIALHGIRAASVLLAGYGVRMVTKSPARSGQFVAGGLGMVFYDLFNEFVAPKIGLAGLSAGRYVSTSELQDILGGTAGYTTTAPPSRIAGFVTPPIEEIYAQ